MKIDLHWLVRFKLRWLLTLFMIASAINHFLTPDAHAAIIPDALPAHRALVYLSGIAQVVLGLGLIPHATRRASAWGLIVLLVLLFPANVNMAIHDLALGERHLPTWVLWVRLPLQAVFIGWAWLFTRQEPAPAVVPAPR